MKFKRNIIFLYYISRINLHGCSKIDSIFSKYYFTSASRQKFLNSISVSKYGYTNLKKIRSYKL